MHNEGKPMCNGGESITLIRAKDALEVATDLWQRETKGESISME